MMWLWLNNIVHTRKGSRGNGFKGVKTYNLYKIKRI